DVVSYEEVVSLPAFTWKTFVLIGANGDGRKGSYYFVSADEMTQAISENLFLEFRSFHGYIFGTKIQMVKEIHVKGKVAILDIEPQALKIVHTAEIASFKDLRSARYAQHFDLIVNNGVGNTVHNILCAFNVACTSPLKTPPASILGQDIQ
uniref:Guanylate kinase-like domain-containing protein n=1 Tax=Leptobrachium leishanense TaxID=445787 RepID=A0A8C5WJZ8_9ANUR